MDNGLVQRQQICDQIKSLRKQSGMSHQEVADKCGMQKMNIIRVESGKHSIGIDIIIRIVEVLGKKIEII